MYFDSLKTNSEISVVFTVTLHGHSKVANQLEHRDKGITYILKRNHFARRYKKQLLRKPKNFFSTLFPPIDTVMSSSPYLDLCSRNTRTRRQSTAAFELGEAYFTDLTSSSTRTVYHSHNISSEKQVQVPLASLNKTKVHTSSCSPIQINNLRKLPEYNNVFVFHKMTSQKTIMMEEGHS